MAVPVTCMTCSCPVEPARWNAAELLPCPRCGTRLQTGVFPAFFRGTPAGHRGDLLVVDNEAACFYHPELRAAVPCDGCGRFMCSLCDIEIDDEHLCPACLQLRRSDREDVRLGSSALLYDRVALALALAPFLATLVCGLLLPIMLVTAPAAMYVSFRYYNRIRSPVPRSKGTFIAAFFLALLQVLSLTGGMVLLVLAYLDR